MNSFDDLIKDLEASEPERARRLELSGKVLALRNRKGITQEKLAELSGISFETIKKLENGAVDVKMETALQIFDVLGYKFEDGESEKK